MSLLSASGLACSKRNRLLFENLNFAVNPGELWHIRGPNGAGKTSLLRILVGLSTPFHGEVLYQDQRLPTVANEFYADLIYFGHKLGVNQTLNAQENMAFWCAQHSVKSDFDQQISLLTQLGLVGLEDLPVGQLSAGQQRRVALSRFWLKSDAKLWVLDEPFTALDVDAVALLKQHIHTHVESGGAVVLTSHQELDMANVKQLYLEYAI